MEIGANARVTPDIPNNVRQNPGVRNRKIGSIPVGGITEIVDGPVCVDNVTWWEIVYYSIMDLPIEGWTGEGQGEDHWLEPYTLPVVISEDGYAQDTTNAPSEHIEIIRRTPPDALTGISWSIGGGSLSRTCYPERFSEPIAAFSDGSEIENGGMVDLTLGPQIGVLAAVCLSESISEGEAIAISPSGVEYRPLFDDYYGVLSVQLPIQAYAEPGVWRLRVKAFEINLRVPPVTRPMIMVFEAVVDGRLLYEQLFLGGFRPNERVFLIAGSIYEFRVDSSGTFAGVVNISQGNYSAIGEYGSFAMWIHSGACAGNFDTRTQYCFTNEQLKYLLYATVWGGNRLAPPGCPAEETYHLTIGGMGGVTSEFPIDLHEGPGREYNIVRQVPPGNPLQVIYGPDCASDRVWWLIEDSEGFLGWITEGQGDEYGISPSNLTCPGAPISRLVSGSDGFVLPNMPNIMRQEPSLDAQQIAEIPAESLFTVLEGPRCNAGYAWWKIDYKGQLGWMPEGEGDLYWLTPILMG